MKAIAVREGLYEGTRIRKGETFEFDEAKYKTKATKPWFVPADRARVVKPGKDAPKTLKEHGARGGKSFVEVMKDKLGFRAGEVQIEVDGRLED